MSEHDSNPLAISIRDLGPIAHAALELRPLTVLVGPSGSGKTFAASTIFSFAEAGARLVKGLKSEPPFQGYTAKLSDLIAHLAASEGADWLERLVGGEHPDPVEFADRMRNFVGLAAAVAGPHLAKVVAGNLSTLLAAKTNTDFDRAGSSGPFGIALHAETLPLADFPSGVLVQSRYLAPSSGLNLSEAFAWLDQWKSRQPIPATGTPSLDRRAAVVFAFVTFGESLQAHFGDRPLYLPTGRTGLMASAPLIGFALAQATGNLQLAGPMSRFMPTLFEAGAAADGEMADLAIAIDTLLHNGRIEAVSSLSPLPELRYVQGDVSVPMERASSSVSELAAVTYFIRKLARKNSLIVLEEPEAHLHPAKQLLLARALARMIHAGLRVVVTTHSDVLVDALGWLLRCNERDDQFRADLPEQERLNVDQVGVYRFRHDADLGGFTADPVVYDPDDGFDRREFLDISADLFNRHADLSEARAKSGGQ